MVSARRSQPRSAAAVCPGRRTPAPGSRGLGTLPDDVTAARHLIAADCQADAASLLAAHLAGLDFSGLPTDPLLIDACVLYATHGTGHDQLGAARYAHRASRHLHAQPTHPRRLAAAHAYGTALHAHGHYSQAVGVYRQLVAAHYTLGRPLDILTATIALAVSLHAAGHCVEALQAIADTWHRWQHTSLADAGLGRTIAEAYVRMLRACRRNHDLLALLHANQHTQAGQLLTTAAANATEHGPADRHLATVCSHTPQTPAGNPRHGEHHNLTDEPTPQYGIPALYGGAGDSSDAHRVPPPTGHPAAEVTTAISRALTTPQAQAVLRHDLGPPAATRTGRWRAALLVGYLTYRRARHAWRASPYTAPVVLPIVVFALTVAAAWVWPR
jgi:hypothetical protein